MTATLVFARVDEILATHAAALGKVYAAYRNHVWRELNFYAAMSGGEVPETVQIAAAFHDLGIWTQDTFDYLGPSLDLASDYLLRNGRQGMEGEVRTIILEHHKLRRYTGPHADSVERFRRADLVDLSLGAITFGLPRTTIRAVRRALPNVGFHRRLVALTVRQIGRDPLHPLPMFRW